MTHLIDDITVNKMVSKGFLFSIFNICETGHINFY